MRISISVLLATALLLWGGESIAGGGRYRVGPPPTPTVTAPPGPRIEEKDSPVILSGAWTPADPGFGWSGGSAMQSNAAGATASISFTGTSIRWIGCRGRKMGVANVSVDGGPPRLVNLF